MSLVAQLVLVAGVLMAAMFIYTWRRIERANVAVAPR